MFISETPEEFDAYFGIRDFRASGREIPPGVDQNVAAEIQDIIDNYGDKRDIDVGEPGEPGWWDFI